MPTFTEKHAEWTMAMRGDDSRPRNSIHSQIVELVDSAAWYRVVLLARDLAPKGESATEHLNGPFHRWIDTTFSDSFFIRFRRLAGGTSDSLNGKRGCYSLLVLQLNAASNDHGGGLSPPSASLGIPIPSDNSRRCRCCKA